MQPAKGFAVTVERCFDHGAGAVSLYRSNQVINAVVSLKAVSRYAMVAGAVSGWVYGLPTIQPVKKRSPAKNKGIEMLFHVSLCMVRRFNCIGIGCCLLCCFLFFLPSIITKNGDKDHLIMVATVISAEY